MAGTLTISQLSDGTNSTSSTNCIQGSAKAWVNFNGTAATIRASYNVSSITRTAAGQWTVTFSNAMSDANYSVSGCGGDSGGRIFCLKDGTAPTASAVYVQTYTSSYVDSTYVMVSIFR